MGDRNGRWAMVIDNGKIVYAENEPSPGGVTVSLKGDRMMVWQVLTAIRSLVPMQSSRSCEATLWAPHDTGQAERIPQDQALSAGGLTGPMEDQ